MTKANLTVVAATGLSADMVSKLSSGIGISRASAPPAGGGKPLLRLLKSGKWVFGVNDDPVQEGSEWAINPLSIQHGWCCWSNYDEKKKNELLGEFMVPVTEPRPAKPEPLESGEWKLQRSCELKCISGDDEGTEVLYKTPSVGGLRAFDVFLGLLQAQLDKDATHPVATVELLFDSYKHTQYGETFVPILEITGWATMSGEREEQPEEEEADEAPAEPVKPVAKARAAKTKAPLTPPPAAGVPRRQRPAGRA